MDFCYIFRNMSTLRRYTSFEDLKNNETSGQATPTDAAKVARRHEQWLAFFKVLSISVKPPRRKRKQGHGEMNYPKAQ